MPTYEYECDACKHRFEAFQMMSDAHLKKCPKCGKSKLQRLIGAGAGIIFKGSGFYETDYKRKSGGGSGDSGSSAKSGSSSDSGSSGSAKSDTASKNESTSAKSETAKGETKKKD
jgi:putative FmdB family regulatory protein